MVSIAKPYFTISYVRFIPRKQKCIKCLAVPLPCHCFEEVDGACSVEAERCTPVSVGGVVVWKQWYNVSGTSQNQPLLWRILRASNNKKSKTITLFRQKWEKCQNRDIVQKLNQSLSMISIRRTPTLCHCKSRSMSFYTSKDLKKRIE